MKTFLQENDKANVYIHKYAFQPHYSLRETGLRFIGIEKDWAENERDRCVACGVCVKVCPKDAISIYKGCYDKGIRCSSW